MDEYTIHVFAQMVRIIFMKVCNKEWYSETYLILFLTSWGSGGFGRCLHTTTIPATIIDVITTAPAATTAASITIVDCFCLSWFDVSAGVGSSSWLVSSVGGVFGKKVMLDKILKILCYLIAFRDAHLTITGNIGWTLTYHKEKVYQSICVYDNIKSNSNMQNRRTFFVFHMPKIQLRMKLMWNTLTYH